MPIVYGLSRVSRSGIELTVINSSRGMRFLHSVSHVSHKGYCEKDLSCDQQLDFCIPEELALYLKPVGNIIQRYRLTCHYYADDSQM